MIDVTCRLTAKNQDQLRNPTLGNRVWTNVYLYLRHLVFAAIWWVKLLEMFVTLMSLKYASPVGWWSCWHFLKPVKFYLNNMVNLHPSTTHIMLTKWHTYGDHRLCNVISLHVYITLHQKFIKHRCVESVMGTSKMSTISGHTLVHVVRCACWPDDVFLHQDIDHFGFNVTKNYYYYWYNCYTRLTASFPGQPG